MSSGQTLVMAEHDGTQLAASVYRSITAAQQFGQHVSVLVIGAGITQVAREAAMINGVQRVLQVDAVTLQHPSAEQISHIVLQMANAYEVLLAAHSSWSKNFLPRVAALLDVGMVSDVLHIIVPRTYQRSVYAGNLLSTVQSQDEQQVLTVHASKFKLASLSQTSAVIERLTVTGSPVPVRWISQTLNQSPRPPLASAKVVVSGGRALGSAERFEAVLAPLANQLQAAIGASRAAVDAGYAPNDLQVGQTGVVVAPALYIAVGISGAIQHTYGMKDSQVIVAINQDPEAPIFQMADYGLVGDLFSVIPALTAALSQANIN